MVPDFQHKWSVFRDDTDNMNPAYINNLFKGYEDGDETVF